MSGAARKTERTFEKQDRGDNTDAEANAAGEWGKSAIIPRTMQALLTL